MIAELGAEEDKRRQAAGEVKIKEPEHGADDFGMEDEDWDVYR